MAAPLHEQGHWQCGTCSGTRVTDKLLGVVGQRVAVHRLSCEACGATGHYDRKPGHKEHIMRSPEHFRWIAEEAESI